MNYILINKPHEWLEAIAALSSNPWLSADKVEVATPMGFPALLAYETKIDPAGGENAGIVLLVTYVSFEGDRTVEGIRESEAIYNGKEYEQYCAEQNAGNLTNFERRRELELAAYKVMP